MHYASSAFSPVPWRLMEAFRCPAVLAVYAWLHRHGWGSQTGCWATVSTIARESGVGVNKVRRVLSQLRREGWIETLERHGYTSIHRVRLEPLQAANETPAAKVKPSRNREPAPSRIREGFAGHDACRVEAVTRVLSVSTAQAPSRNREPAPSLIRDPLQNHGPLTELQGDPSRNRETPPHGSVRGPLTESLGKQETHKQETQEQEKKNPPYPPEGGNGLTAAAHQPQPLIDLLPVSTTAEQPPATMPVKTKGSRPKGSAKGHSQDDARRLVAIWNENRPGGWSALSCVTADRWDVVDKWSAALGGFESFLLALPVALANAGRDRFWCAPGHGWNSFMGYGAKTGKAHFLTFLEQEQAYAPTVNRDGSLTFAGTAIQAMNNPTPQLF